MSTSAAVEFNLDEAIQILERTPATLRGLLEDLSAEWLNYQEDPEAWSPFTVLVHFIHNDRTNWLARALVILSDGEPREFAPIRQLPEGGLPGDRPVGDLLEEFAQLRQQRLTELRELSLGASDFERQGIHPKFGTVTLGQLLATWVAHDLNHIHQIAKTLAKRYQEAVGPWRQFLGILNV